MDRENIFSLADVNIDATDLHNLLSNSPFNQMNINLSEALSYPFRFSFSYAETMGEYGFQQIYSKPFESKYLFDTLKFLSEKCISELSCDTALEELGREQHDLHLHFHSTFSNTLRNLLEKQFNTDVMNIPPIYHISTYFSQPYKKGETINKTPRVYFMVGNLGLIYLLYYDPNHTITKDTTQLDKKNKRKMTAKEAQRMILKKYGK